MKFRMEVKYDLTNQKESQTGDSVIPISFFIVAIALVIMPLLLPVSISPPNNNNDNSSSASSTTSLPEAYAQLSENYNNTVTARLGHPFQIQINQTAILAPDNMSIRFLDVPEDSRCLASVVCGKDS